MKDMKEEQNLVKPNVGGNTSFVKEHDGRPGEKELLQVFEELLSRMECILFGHIQHRSCCRSDEN